MTTSPTRFASALFLSLSLFVLPACFHAGMTRDAFFNDGGIKQASFELKCPQQQLEVVELGQGTVGVSGCGKRATYTGVYRGGWINNSGVSEDANGAPAPAPPAK